MRRRWIRATILGGLALAGLTGCQAGGLGLKRKPADEPAFVAGDQDGMLVAAKPSRPAPPEFVERHPLLSKPREVYENSGNNTVVKVAGATFVGVPMGLFGELRQIVRGTPPASQGLGPSAGGR